MGEAGPLLVAVLALAVIVLFLVPVRHVRGLALGFSFAIGSFGLTQTLPTPIRATVLSTIAVLLAVSMVRARTTPTRYRGLQWVIVAYWFVFLTGVAVTYPQSVAMWAFLGVVCLFASHVALRLDRGSLRLFFRVVIGATTLHVGVALLEVFVWRAPPYAPSTIVRMNPFLLDSVARAQSGLGHPILFGMTMAVGLVLVWINAPGFRPRFRMAMLGVAGLGLFLSGTRSALLAAAAAIVVHLATRPGLMKWLRNVILAFGAGIVMLGLGLGNSVATLATDLVSSGSWLQRLGSLLRVPEILARPLPEVLFGNGFGRERELFERGVLVSPYNFMVVDNMLVYALAMTGIVGFIALLIPYVAFFARGDRGSRAIVLVVFGMMFSFDSMTWSFATLMVFVFLSIPAVTRAPLSRRSIGVDEALTDVKQLEPAR